jgi:ubiquitin C-terminal hydrolase
MDPYDAALVPPGFGLNNTGVICYFNSFLQLFASCTAFTRQVLLNMEDLRRTRTGAAMVAFCMAYARIDPNTGAITARAAPAPDIAFMSSRVLAAFMADLAEHHPKIQLGGGQDCASQVIDCICDMMQYRPSGPDENKNVLADSLVLNTMIHRYACRLHCLACKAAKHVPTDSATTIHIFDIYRLIKTPPTTPKEFASALRRQINVEEQPDYKCEACDAHVRTVRVYNLEVVPEIIICMFNRFVEYAGGSRDVHYFPDAFSLPAIGGGTLEYQLVGQIEHVGSMAGGHYWAHGRRAGDAIYMLNDFGVSPSAFVPTANTYLIAYHFVGQLPAPTEARRPVTRSMAS